MKKFLIILIILLTSFTTNKYCEGWEDGYIEGYCYENPNCIKPIVPICPIPTVNCSDGYKCGYNRGFSKGKKDKK